MAATPFSLAGGKAAFGGMRPGAARSIMDDDDEEDDDNGRQKIGLREDAISLDQVCAFHFTLKYPLFSPITPGQAYYDAERLAKHARMICLRSVFTIFSSLYIRLLVTLFTTSVYGPTFDVLFEKELEIICTTSL